MKRATPLKRTELRRGSKELKRTPMKRGGHLPRKTPVKRENRKRSGERRKKAFGPQSALCRTLPCCVCGKPPPRKGQTDPHHEPPRSRGGLDFDTVPLCADDPATGYLGCHSKRHKRPAVFWKLAGVDWRRVRDDLRSFLSAPAE